MRTTALICLAGALAGCRPSVTSAPATAPVATAPPEVADATAASWAVMWERTVGWLSSTPLFSPDDGALISGGARFDPGGRFVGWVPAHVPGGRMIAELVALVPGDRALATTTGEGSELVLVALGDPPERARARASVHVEDLVVDGDRVLVHSGDAVVELALPDLHQVQRIDVAAPSYFAGRLAALSAGGLAYTVPAGEGDTALVVRTAAGERRLVDGGIDEVAFSATGDAVALWSEDGRLRILALPSGQLLAATRLPLAGERALAVAAGGRAVAALSCADVTVLDRAGDRLVASFAARIDNGGGRDGCAYLSGFGFSPAGDRLAMAAQELTVLARGVSPAAAPALRYRPALPAGFSPRADSAAGLVYPSGTGLAPMPRLAAAYEYDGEVWAEVRVVVRDAGQLAGEGDLARWGERLLVRYEPLVRSELDPNRIDELDAEVMPYRRAFVDPRGRRNLEYALFLRDGCEPSDRYVRYVEAGGQLIEITIQTEVGVGPDVLAPWIEQFFDRALGDGADNRVLAAKILRRGGC